jgi:hypothetical protein
MSSISKRSIPLLVTLFVAFSNAGTAHGVDADMAGRYKGSVVDAICKDGGAWMKCYKLDPLQCSKLSGAFVDACFDKLVAQRTNPVANEAEVQVVSDNILSCIRSSFKARYGEKRDTQECANVY